KVTIEERLARAFGALLKPVVWQGELAGLQPKCDNSALLDHLARMAQCGEDEHHKPGRSHGFDPSLASTSLASTTHGQDYRQASR
ncbi:hypothetical protein, partial [Novosphingobium sp.]|uniref:hypothetical protein n=1 Tax=Novosphingobium sp. TaxID=1874826 RepID=UPI0025D68AF4